MNFNFKIKQNKSIQPIGFSYVKYTYLNMNTEKLEEF